MLCYDVSYDLSKLKERHVIVSCDQLREALRAAATLLFSNLVTEMCSVLNVLLTIFLVALVKLIYLLFLSVCGYFVSCLSGVSSNEYFLLVGGIIKNIPLVRDTDTKLSLTRKHSVV